jgi:hypothetical protein
MGARMYRRKFAHPDVLEDAENRKLALLIDEGVIREDCKVDVQLRLPGSS